LILIFISYLDKRAIYHYFFNSDFAVEIVARISNTKQIRVSGYFLDERIVNYSEFKKCSERLSCEGFRSRSRFRLQNLGLTGINIHLKVYGIWRQIKTAEFSGI